MSLLTLTQSACDRIGVARPSQIIGSSDQQTRSLLGLAGQEGVELARRHSWQALITEATFVTTATETQSGAIPADFSRFVPDTFWNRTRNWRVAGPVSPQRWQAIKSGLIVQPWGSFRQRGNTLLLSPVPSAGDTIAFEYVSDYWCENAAGTVGRAMWEADDDVARLDEELISLGVVWRFQRARGLDYSESFRTYETEVVRMMARDGGQATLDMGMGNDGSSVLDPTVPESTWSIT
jgi:hypothetical protein